MVNDRRRRENRPRPLTERQTLRDAMLKSVGSKGLYSGRRLASIPEELFEEILSERGHPKSSAALYRRAKYSLAVDGLIQHLRVAQENGCLEDVLDEVFG